MLLNDKQIKELVRTHNLISPFSEENLNPFGCDLLLASKFLIPVSDYAMNAIIDPLDTSNLKFEEYEGDYCLIPPNSFILSCSKEVITMPPNITGICLGRSTYARCGIITNVTPLEAGWKGVVTIEMSNSSRLPAKVYADKGIIQVLFLKGDLPDRSYATKGEAKYQNQTGITLARGL